MPELLTLLSELQSLGSPKKAKILQRFFKTGPGEYGEGDVFLGITVPQSRQLARKFSGLPISGITKLIRSKMHEARLIALLILVHNFQAKDKAEQGKIYSFYLAHTRYINNWDLVDLTADKIVGAYLQNQSRKILYSLARSSSLWERRIAMMATFHFIKHGDADDAIRIARILLHDQHDLIQKAVGWMLREVGKRVSLATERTFLDAHAHHMPRTTLRYAIERMSHVERKKYLAKSKHLKTANPEKD